MDHLHGGINKRGISEFEAVEVLVYSIRYYIS